MTVQPQLGLQVEGRGGGQIESLNDWSSKGGPTQDHRTSHVVLGRTGGADIETTLNNCPLGYMGDNPVFRRKMASWNRHIIDMVEMEL